MPTELDLQAISDAALVNPPLTRTVASTEDVSFIPMADVSDTGQWIGRQTRQQRQVSVGYTPFEERDVLFAKITPCMENGKGCHAIGLVNGIGYGSTEFHVLRARSGTNDRFLYHWSVTDAVRKKAETFMIGSAGQQRVQAGFFDHFQIPMLGEDEQRFGAQVLDTADKAIAKTQTLIAKLKAIKQGLLHDLLTRGLDDNGDLRDPEKHPGQFKDSELGRIPKGWLVFSVNDVGRIVAGATPSRAVPSYWSGEIPWITPTDMTALTSDYIKGGQDSLTRKGLGSCAAILLPPGSLVVTTRASLGLAAITCCELATNQGFKNVIPDCGWDGTFLCYCFRRLTAEMVKRASGTTFLEISRTQFGLVRFAAPRLESGEQERIGKIIRAQAHRIELEVRHLSKLKAVKKGLMQDLLTGRVRVSAGNVLAFVTG